MASMKNSKPYSVKNKLVPPLPKKIDIEPTIQCNFACSICQRNYWDRRSKDLDLHQFQNIVRQFPELEEIKLQGMGEPLLNSEFFDMVRFAKDKGLRVSTYSNGSLLSNRETRLKFLDSGIDLVRFSIDAAEKELFEKIRAGSDFKKVIEGIGEFNALANVNRSPKVEIWTVVLTSNVNNLESIAQLAGELGIDTIHLQVILNTFSYKTEIQDMLGEFKVDKRRFEQICNGMKAVCESHSIELIIESSKAYSKQKPCHWPFDRAFISVEGYVVPCCTIADPRVINMGNLFQEEFRTIWSNKRYIEFRKSILTNQLTSPCKSCYDYLAQ